MGGGCEEEGEGEGRGGRAMDGMAGGRDGREESWKDEVGGGMRRSLRPGID